MPALPDHIQQSHHDTNTSTHNEATLNPSAPSIQMGFAQNGAAAGMDLSALQGISPQQLALIAHLLQTGQIPLPPPPPSGAAQATSISSPNGSLVAPVAQQCHRPSPAKAMQKDMVADREEGELDDESGEGEPLAADNTMTTPPKGSRGRDQDALAKQVGAKDISRGDPKARPPPTTRRSAVRKPSSLQTVTNVGQSIDEEASIKEFLVEMQNAGFGFQQMSKEVTNISGLRRLYERLNVSMTDDLTVNGASSIIAGPQSQDVPKKLVAKPPATTKPNAPLDRDAFIARLQAAKNKKPALSPAPQDRDAFIARLQAAKNKSSAISPATPQPNARATTKTEPAVAPASATAPTSTATKPSSPFGERERTKMNDLVKQRLAALNAKRAADLEAGRARVSAPMVDVSESSDGSNGRISRTSGDMKPSLGDGLSEASLKSAVQPPGASSQTLSPLELRDTEIAPLSATANPSKAPRPSAHPLTPSPILNRGSGLPGLFTSATFPNAVQINATVTPPIYPAGHNSHHTTLVTQPEEHSHAQALMPNAINFRNQHLAVDPKASSELDGDHMYASADDQLQPEETFIIQDSDEDDSGDDMEIDEPEQDDPATTQNHAHTQSLSRPVELHTNGESSRTIGDSKTVTFDSTDSAYQRKVEAIADLRNRIAKSEQWKRQKINGSEYCIVSGEPAANTVPNGMDRSSNVLTSDNARSIGGAVESSGDRGSMHNDALTAEQINSSLIEIPLKPIETLAATEPLSASTPSRRQEKELLRQRLEAARRQIEEASSGNATIAHTPLQTRENSSPVTTSPSGIPLLAEYAPASIPVGGSAHMVIAEQTADEAEAADLSFSDEEEAMYGSIEATNKNGVMLPLNDTIHTSALPSRDTTGNQQTTTGTVARPEQESSPTTPTYNVATSLRVSPVPGGGMYEDTAEFIGAETLLEPHGIIHNKSPEQDRNDVESQEIVDEDDLDEIYEPFEQQQTNQEASITLGDTQGVFDTESDDDDSEEDGEASMDTSDDSEDAPNDLEDHQQHGQTQPASYKPSFESSSEAGDTDEVVALVEDQHPYVANDLAPELQPSKEELDMPATQPSNLISFRAYESPLALFKDFRYHETYLRTIQGGYKSLTYCHKIDPFVTICPNEIAGGECRAHACQHQHFKDMSLSDNDLLRTMGTERIPLKTPEEDRQWKSGLNEVVQELRNTDQGKDVAAIARRIAEYRRKFREDATKTLLLE